MLLANIAYALTFSYLKKAPYDFQLICFRQNMTQRPAVEIFDEWAHSGKDEGMEKGHAPAVNSMLNLILPKLDNDFSAIDIGCGNGWVVRKLKSLGAINAHGVDGAPEMINKAQNKDGDNTYHHALLPNWNPPQRFDLVHSMEFLYYLDDPLIMLKKIHDNWLENQGWFIAGIDHYKEHEKSLIWPERVGVKMNTMSINEWKNLMNLAGFNLIEMHQVEGENDFPGTLVMMGQAIHPEGHKS